MKDRRSADRFVSYDKKIIIYQQGVELVGKIKDISENGMKIEIPLFPKCSIRKGDFLFAFTYQEDDNKKKIVNGKGTIVRKQDSCVGCKIFDTTNYKDFYMRVVAKSFFHLDIDV